MEIPCKSSANVQLGLLSACCSLSHGACRACTHAAVQLQKKTASLLLLQVAYMEEASRAYDPKLGAKLLGMLWWVYSGCSTMELNGKDVCVSP